MLGWKSYNFIALVLILQAMVFFVVYANISTARMIIGFIYLLIVPGAVILKLLALERLDVSEKILFSASLSIAFIMFIGVAINELGKLVISNPLSLDILLISINLVLLSVALIGTRRYTDSNLTDTQQAKLSGYLVSILIFVFLSLLGALGILNVNSSGNNLLILGLIIAVCVIVTLAFVSEKIIPSKIYPLILFSIFICLLLFLGITPTLVTPYITGTGDITHEYYVYRLTGQYWYSELPSDFGYYFRTDSYYSMPSITILPTIFSTITAMDSIFLFRIFYPIITAFIAIGAYKVYQTQTDNKTAFLATFFLITITVGKGMGSAKQLVAELFYVLIFLLLFEKSVDPLKRRLLLIFFGTGLILSHYGLTYIFMFNVVVAVFIFSFLHFRKTGHINISQTKIPLTFIVLFLTIAFSWYVYINRSATFTPLVETIETVGRNLGQFFNLESRGTALQGLGIVETPSVFYRISSILFLFTEFLLVVGFVKLLIGKNKKSRFSIEYKVFAAINMAIIAVNLLLPSIADTFLMARFYQITLILLAPLAIVGGKAILNLILNHRYQKFYPTVLLLLIFIPLFLFQTQFVYEVTGDRSYSLALSGYRWSSTELYYYTVNDQEVFSAKWIAQYSGTSTVIYSDQTSLSGVLLAYGNITGRNIKQLIGTDRLTSGDVIYIADSDLVDKGYVFNTTLLSPVMEQKNTIYSNGKTVIYKGQGSPSAIDD